MTTTATAMHGVADEFLVDAVLRYGSSVTSFLLESDCQVFRTNDIDGLIGYRVAWNCVVALGDPVCAQTDVPRLTWAFREFCRDARWPIVYAITTAKFASYARARGWGTVEFGAEQVISPAAFVEAHTRCRRLRQKLTRARREGVTVSQYDPLLSPDPHLEADLEHVAIAWQQARRGPQAYMAPVRVFAARKVARWFYASLGSKRIGVMRMVQAANGRGHVAAHIAWLPEAPAGTSELLIAEALTMLACEGSDSATLGFVPVTRLQDVSGLKPISEHFTRVSFNMVSSMVNFGAKATFWRKFPAMRREPIYLVFDPPCLGVRQAACLWSSFHVGLRP